MVWLIRMDQWLRCPNSMLIMRSMPQADWCCLLLWIATRIWFCGHARRRICDEDQRRNVSSDCCQRWRGILNSARKLQSMSEDELFDVSLPRVDEIIRTGTGAVEIKSGYGLTVKDELKMLRVAKGLQSESPLTVKTTLGAHAVPKRIRKSRLHQIDCRRDDSQPWLPENLADYIDVFMRMDSFWWNHSNCWSWKNLNEAAHSRQSIESFRWRASGRASWCDQRWSFGEHGRCRLKR